MLESLNRPFPRALSHPAALEQKKYALTAMQVSADGLNVICSTNMEYIQVTWRKKSA